MRSSFDLIIFDLDGTLIEFHQEYLFEQTFKILEELKHPPVEKSILKHHFSMFDYFAFVTERQEHFVETFWTSFDWENFPKPKNIPNALELLDQLTNAGYSMAIATARLTTETALRQELAHTKLLDFISHVSTRNSETVDWKDKTEMILGVCKAHNVPPERTVMIGDVPADIQSAKQVRIGLSIAVKSGGIKEEVLAATSPDYIIETIADLQSLMIKG